MQYTIPTIESLETTEQIDAMGETIKKRKYVSVPVKNSLYYTHNGTLVKFLKHLEAFGGNLVRVVELQKQGLPKDDTDIIVYSLFDAPPPSDFIKTHNGW